MHYILSHFGGERLVIASFAVGIMERLIELGIDYASERVAFGRPLLGFQTWRHRFSEMATQLEATRALAYQAARLLSDGDPTGELYFCGISGWYEFEGSDFRDTDWFSAVIGDTGVMTASLMPERRSHLFQISTDCNTAEVLQQAPADPCVEALLTIEGEPGEVVWLWVGPQDFTPPLGFQGHEFDYHLWFTGIEDDVVATEANTWSEVKGLYR